MGSCRSSVGSIHELYPSIEIKDERPCLIRVVEDMKKRSLSYHTYQALVLIVTFLSYTTYHLTRKTSSIVKSALDPQAPTSPLLDLKSYPWQKNYLHQSSGNATLLGTSSHDDGWAPFNGSNGTALLGYLDVAFLAVYAAGMFFSGHLGDRMNLRVFLTIGMLGTGFFTALFGLGYWFNIHNFYYYLVVQMLAGVFQSTGWPSVVAVVGNWFGKGSRGLIMGVWNAHTSFGNITGSLIASALLKYGWGWSMFVPGIIIGFFGLVVFFLLPVSPLSVGMYMGDDDTNSPKKDYLEESFIPMEGIDDTQDEEGHAIGFLEAWKIPGVATYALCLFFAKLVAYTFLYWLPFYISYTEIGGEYLSSETAGNLSTFFDIGGVIGGILAGFVSDKLDARAITAAAFTYFTIPALYIYRNYGFINIYMNIGLMFVAGVFVNGPYALITTAVSADLGTHASLRGNSRALATVTAIIDGTGSIGAAVGPLLTGYLSAISWDAVFIMLMTASLTAGILLTKLVIDEVRAKIDNSRSPSGSRADVLV